MEMDYNTSDTDSDEVFMGPITKREIVARLKYYKILSEEYLEPINDLKKSDVVDDDIVSFYWNIFTSRENMAYSKNPNQNKSILQDLELRKSVFGTPGNESMRRNNTPAESFQTEKSDEQSEPINDSLNRSRNNTPAESSRKEHFDEQSEPFNDSLNRSRNNTPAEFSHIEKSDEQFEFNDSLNRSRDSLHEPFEYSIITISDASYESNEMRNETLEEIQIKLEDITNDENEIDVIEEQISNSLKIDKTPEVESDVLKNNEEEYNSLIIDENPTAEEPNILQNSRPVEMSILSDTFITKNSDLENYCSIPSFHEQSDQSEQSDSFNDTLEEMEMLMKFGENYMKQKQDTIYPDSSATSSNQSNISERFNETEEIYEKISKRSSSSKSINKNESHSPLPNEKKSNTPSTKTQSFLKPSNHIDAHFKVPGKAPRSAKKSPNYKNIVSPISLYINNSPKVPLIKKVNQPTIHSATYREIDSKKSSEKSQEQAIPDHLPLPIRTYKLAPKNIFLSKENEPHMPNNIRKLIKGPLNPEIIKHVGRVKATPDLPASPSTIFSNDGDLTILSSTSASEGIFNISTNSEGDVSLYVSKNAARTNFSTKK